MTRLIIAEKHSVAQAIAQALDTSAIRKDGYLQCADTLVTWAQGHLVNLATPDQYQDHDWGRWRMDTLPLTRHLTGNLSSTGRKAPTGNSRPSNSSSNEMT